MKLDYMHVLLETLSPDNLLSWDTLIPVFAFLLLQKALPDSIVPGLLFPRFLHFLSVDFLAQLGFQLLNVAKKLQEQNNSVQ